MINSLAVLLALSVHTARFVWLPNAPEDNVTAYHIYDVTPDFTPPGPVALAVRWSQKTQTESHSWTNVVHLGEAGMRAMPDSGARVTPGHQSPALVYQLNFEHSGTNYVWIRGHAISDGNSVHVHLSGSLAPTAGNITFPVGPGWQWSSSVGGGARAFVLVSEPGIHPVEVYMREDGFAFERILFTTNAQADPRTNQTRMATTTDTNATITNLDLTLPRTFAATAENEAGESDLSNTATITKPVAPPKTPTGFKWAEENR